MVLSRLHLPWSLCSQSPALRGELSDPALSHLLDLATLAPGAELQQCCAALATHINAAPGCLTASECVDVDGGDGWTPLMEAVLRMNVPVVTALVQCGADVHRRCRGLSAAFWATALQLDAAAPDLPPALLELTAEEGEALLRVEAAKRAGVTAALLLDLSLSVGRAPAAAAGTRYGRCTTGRG